MGTQAWFSRLREQPVASLSGDIERPTKSNISHRLAAASKPS
jgi:hypothetical protein